MTTGAKSPSEFGRSMSDRSPMRKLFDACFAGNLHEARKLVELHGTEIMQKTDAAGDWPIQAAASEGHLEIVKFLVEAGQPFDVMGMCSTPLYDAATAGHLPVVEYLLDIGADINFTGSDGSVFMGTLQLRYCTNVSLYLIERGVDMYSRDEHGNDSMYWVLKRDNAPVFVALAKKGLLPKLNSEPALDYLMSCGRPGDGAIPRIVAACLKDPTLSGALTEERLQNFARCAKDPQVCGLLLSEATAVSVRQAMRRQDAPGPVVGLIDDAIALKEDKSILPVPRKDWGTAL